MMQEIMSTEKATVIITPQVASQISCLHNQCPKNTEWSGLLIYRILEGSVEDAKNLKIQAEGIFPMNFGTAVFTEFESNLDWLTMIEKFPQIDPLSDKKDISYGIGKIHTHHNMNTFHSGTDTKDLYDSMSKFPMFLSLIVNYACEPEAKIAIEAKTEKTTVEWFNWELKNFKLKHKKPREKKQEAKPACYIIDCNVVYQQDQWFIDQTNKVKKEAEEKTKAIKTVIYPYNSGGYQFQGYNQNSQIGFQYGNSGKKEWWLKPSKNKEGIRTIHSHHYSSKVNQQVLGEIDDLLLLGTSTGFTGWKALQQAAEWVDYPQLDNYIKAIKQFYSTWYFQNFWADSISMGEEEEVAYSVLKFLSYHESLWLTKHLQVAINELVDEMELEDAKQSV